MVPATVNPTYQGHEKSNCTKAIKAKNISIIVEPIRITPLFLLLSVSGSM